MTLIPHRRPEPVRIRNVAVLFACASLGTVGVAIVAAANSVKPLKSFHVSICQGEFRRTDGRLHSTAINNGCEATVAAGRPVEITFSSRDYVYTVYQPDTKTSAVVLPGATATMSLTVKSGRWPVNIVQGCGKLFSGHQESLVLNAVE